MRQRLSVVVAHRPLLIYAFMIGRCTQPSCAIFDETLADIDAFLKRVEAIGVRGIGGQKWAEWKKR